MKTNLKKNIAYNFIYQILILLLPFITAPYLSRTIGANGVGIYSFSQSIALYFTYFTLLGLSNYGNRSIAAVQSDRKARSELFWEIYAMQLLMSFISIAVYIIYIIFFSVDIISALIMIMWVVSAMFDVNWFFFGMEQFKLTVIRNTVIKTLSVVSIFVFIHSSEDIYLYIGIMAFSTLLSQLCLWPYMRKFVDFCKPSWNGIKRHFKPNFKLFIPIIAASVYNIMDKIMLGYMSDMSEVGYYENAEKIIKMVQSLIVAVGTVMLPRISAMFSKNEDNQSRKYFDTAMEAVIIYVSVVIFGIMSIKEVFTDVYFGEGYAKTSVLLGYLIVTVFFFGIGNVLRTQYLIPKKLDKIYIHSAIFGAVLNLVANFILIPFMASTGASIATIIAEVSVCCYQFYMVRKDISFRKYIPSVIACMTSGAIMYIILQFIPVFDNKILYLFTLVLCGFVVFVPLVLVFILARSKLKKFKNK